MLACESIETYKRRVTCVFFHCYFDRWGDNIRSPTTYLLTMAFQCQYCPKNFTRRYNLNCHIRLCHPGQLQNGGEGLKQCQAGGHLAKISPENNWSADVSGVAGFNDSPSYLRHHQNNPLTSQPTPQQPLPDPLGRSIISLDQTMQDICDEAPEMRHKSERLELRYWSKCRTKYKGKW